MTADFIEGLIDVVRPPADVDQPPPPTVAAREEEKKSEAKPPVETAPEEKPEVEPSQEEEAVEQEIKPADSSPEEEPEDSERSPQSDTENDDWDEAFAAAIAKPKWVRKQVFKVLAIFWTAHQRDLGPITAKNASAIGDELGLVIRHENVRKVIRTRLTDEIETSTVEESQPPTYQYEMKEAGVQFFTEEYLNKALDDD